MPTADVLLGDAPLAIVWNPGLPCLKVRDQRIEHLAIPGLAPIYFQHPNGCRNVTAPQPAVEPYEQLRSGFPALADPAAQLCTFLMEVVPIQNHSLGGDLRQGLGEEHPNPACAVGNQQEGAPALQC